MSQEIRVRIAPSPTGYPHIGTIYQAMFDYVFAKKYNGKFVVRIEDTDRERFVEDAEKVIFDSLSWFDLDADEDPIKGGPHGPYRQSERLDLYKKYAEQLLANKHAYYCFCTKERLDEMRKKQGSEKKAPRYDRTCLRLSEKEIEVNLKDNLKHVIRMRTPDDEIVVVRDTIVGDVRFETNIIDDQILIKSDGFPTYHLAVVVDDYLMKITHVFRGTEWLSSTPKHILLYRFLNIEKNLPVFIHLPLILNTEGGGKLSKRNSHTSVDFYKEQGYLPKAILNYLANIVWNHPEGKEIYPLEEFGKAFDINSDKIADVTSTGARFDLKKLDWINGEYIKKLSDTELLNSLIQFRSDFDRDILLKIIPLIRERIKKLADIKEFEFFFIEPEYEKELLQWKQYDLQKIRIILEKTERIIEENFENDLRKKLDELAQEIGDKGLVYWPLRLALSGQKASPDPIDIAMILGKEKTLNRVKVSLAKFF